MAISGLCIWFRWIYSLFVVVLPMAAGMSQTKGTDDARFTKTRSRTHSLWAAGERRDKAPITQDLKLSSAAECVTSAYLAGLETPAEPCHPLL
jgi:hypothetical protein